MAWSAADTAAMYLPPVVHPRAVGLSPFVPPPPLLVERDRADSLGFYFTGADSDGAAQIDPDAALGNFRSATEMEPLAWLISFPLSGLTLDRVSSAIGEGVATLSAQTANRVRLTPPGGTVGAGVHLSDGDTDIAVAGDDTSKFIRLTRDGTTDFAGTASLTLAFFFNNVLAMSNVSEAQRAAGVDTYHAIMLRAHGTGAVNDIALWIATIATQATTDDTQLGASGTGTIVTTDTFADWPDEGWAHVRESGGATREIIYYTSRSDTTLTVSVAGHRARLGTSAGAGAADDTVDAVPGVRIALEAVDGSDKIQTIADENAAPTGRTWDTGITSATGLSIAFLDTQHNHAVWLHREIPAAAIRVPEAPIAINVQYGDGMDTYDQTPRGLYRVATDAQYELYRGSDGSPDFTAAPYETFSTLPHTTAALAVGTDHYFVLRYRNEYGLPTANITETIISLDGGGDENATPPSAPTETAIVPAASGAVFVTAKYQYTKDESNAAVSWLVYITSDGSGPLAQSPTVVTMKKVDGIEKLRWTSGTYADGLTIKVVVRVRRIDSGPVNVDSTNTTVVSTTSDTDGPAIVTGQIGYGAIAGQRL